MFPKTVRGIDLKKYKKAFLKSVCFFGAAALLFTAYNPLFSAKEKAVAIKAGKIQTITKGMIENGIILIRNDRIAEIGTEVDIPSDAEVFNFQDKFIMPGVVSPDSNIGIFRRTGEEVALAALQVGQGKNFANYPALFSVYPEHPDFRLALMNGFTTLAVSPPPAGISGLGAIIKPYGDKLKDILVRDKAFLKITVYVNTPFWNMLKGALEEAQKKLDEQRKKQEEEKKKEEDKKKAEEKEKEEEEKEEPTISETTKVFMEILEGKYPIVAECSQPASISHLLELVSEYPKIRLIISGGPDTYRAGDLLKEKNIPVILSPTIMTRLRWSIAERTNYVLKCQSLGLKIAFQAPGDVEDQIHLFHFLNQLFQLGVKRDVLLKGVTIIPAELLGVDKLVGSLEKGKKADLIVLKDDPLENIPFVEKVMLGGKFIQ